MLFERFRLCIREVGGAAPPDGSGKPAFPWSLGRPGEGENLPGWESLGLADGRHILPIGVAIVVYCFEVRPGRSRNRSRWCNKFATCIEIEVIIQEGGFFITEGRSGSRSGARLRLARAPACYACRRNGPVYLHRFFISRIPRFDAEIVVPAATPLIGYGGEWIVHVAAVVEEACGTAM